MLRRPATSYLPDMTIRSMDDGRIVVDYSPAALAFFVELFLEQESETGAAQPRPQAARAADNVGGEPPQPALARLC
jgi:hypothetical protein